MKALVRLKEKDRITLVYFHLCFLTEGHQLVASEFQLFILWSQVQYMYKKSISSFELLKSMNLCMS